MMLNSMMGLAEKRLNEKKPAQATSRKGCMRGKGGPENATCMYKGVRQRTWGKWVAEIREANNGARLRLGTFDTSYEAAMAYDAAARKLHGPTAKLNLPELAATTRFPPSSGSFSIIRVTEGFYGNHLPVVNPGTLLCENNSYPTNEKPEVLKKFDYSENLNVNLPEFDDSAIWKEAAATMDYQAMADPGIFFDDYDDETFWGPIKFPWE